MDTPALWIVAIVAEAVSDGHHPSGVRPGRAEQLTLSRILITHPRDTISPVLSIGSIVMGVDDMRRGMAFWMQALDYVPRDDDIDDSWNVLVPRGGTGVQLALVLSDSPLQDVPRLHLDLYAGDAADQAAEVERLVSLGAQRVDWALYPEDPDFVVLADPEGNRFCIIDTSRG